MTRREGGLGTVWAIALGAGALRLLLFLGLDLYADESYYWLWSRRPSLGYFDHPPMVAWLIRASTAVVPGELGVRILFLACGVLAVVFAALVARELSDDPRAPVVAALLAATAPILTLTGALALPDAPVEAAYAASTWLVARARGRRWIWAGVAVGLALLSKYTAAALAPALFLLVAWDRELREELRTPWPWLGGLVAVAIFLPNLAWNARHGWVSIVVQLRHGFGGKVEPQMVLQYLGGLLGGPGPVVVPLAVWTLARTRTSAGKRIAAASLLPVLVTVISATQGPVEANWGALVYPGLAGAAAAGLVGLRPAVGRWLLWGNVGLGLAAAAFFASQSRHPTLVPVDAPLVERFRGWREYGERARAAAAEACAQIGNPTGCDGKDPFVFPGSYQDAAQLAYYAGWTRIGPASERPSQLDLWNERPAPGTPFLRWNSDPGRDPKALFRGEGPSRPVPFEVLLDGSVLRRGRVTAWKSYLGPLRRPSVDLHYLQDALPP